MADFTPQQISEILAEFFDVVGTRQYIGARYVPIFGRKNETSIEWDDSAPYEPLTVVLYRGNSYTSKQYVPAGVEITDTGYWAETGAYNAQVEQYRQEVLSFQGQIDDLDETLRDVLVPFPDVDGYSKYGDNGQVLSTLGNGKTRWVAPVEVTDEVATPIIEEWLDEHPEATTSVEDNSITNAKLYEFGIKQDASIAYKDLTGIFPQPYQQFVNGVYNVNSGLINQSNIALITQIPSYFSDAVVVRCDTSVHTRALYFDGYDISVGHFINATTWNGDDISIPANSYAMIQIKHPDDTPITLGDKVKITIKSLVIPDDSITADKIADGAVTEPKIANNSVAGRAIVDNGITDEKLVSYGIKQVLESSYEQITGIVNNPFSTFVMGLYNVGGGYIQSATKTIINDVPSYYPNATRVSCDNGFMFRVLYFDGFDISTGHFRTATAWDGNDVIINANSYVLIQASIDLVADVTLDIKSKVHISRYAGQEETNTITLNNTDTIPSVLNLRRHCGYSSGSFIDTTTPNPLVLLHFSDIHASSSNLARIIRYMQENPTYFDDAICTGDMTANYYGDNSYTFWSNTTGTSNILLASGNHDVYMSAATDMADQATMAQIYERWLAPNISNWGVTYQTNKTYYYKDYANNNVRLIVIDTNTAYDQDLSTEQDAQMAWFAQTLESARVANLHVMVACHFMVKTPQRVESSFMSANLNPASIGGWIDQDFIDAVTAFKANGGRFIAWITGHGHCDVTIRPTSDQTQFDIGIANAHMNNLGGDMERVAGTRTQDVINLYGIDTKNSMLRVVRIGANRNFYMHHRDTLTYDYANNRVVEG